ncbi:MAG: redox-regulated ATPase YchF [Nitrososphaera sp.]|uniref:redox-regulated ATPase YchF n=1 Tax=Nitrososphaera sp. TaxID=1971748 RepID=UPI00183EB193|nr:redox-regulated ATPase YchF [Nitrososphaera sp.]NWG37072.1 redox-regulated ATPase YchF [Nitrososphaera sp.]
MIIGLIGKANVGKSTFFNAATELAVPSANYPFTTIEPNVGVAYARIRCTCREFGVQDNPVHSMCIDGNRFIPVKLIDVAGLVPGAHAGKGLGNKFLDDARQADALIHVVDASGSTDSGGKPVPAGTEDPMSDIKFVEEEFDLWMAGIVSRDWSKTAREAENQGQKLEQMLAKRLSGLAIPEHHVFSAIHESGLGSKKPTLWTEDDILHFCKVLRARAKPFLVAANKADLPTAEANIAKMKQAGMKVVPCASEAESMLKKASKKGVLHYLPGDNSFEVKPSMQLNEQQKKALDLVKGLIEKYGSTGVQDAINTACFDLLHLVAVYPVEDEVKLADKKGNVLPDVRLLPEGSTAKDLAATVHADLAKGFLYAIDARTKQRIGADHKLKAGDVIKIVSAASRG